MEMLAFERWDYPRAEDAALIERCKSALDSLREGTRRTRCQWPIDEKLGVTGNNDLAEDMKCISQALGLRSFYHVKMGQPAEGLRDALALMRLARQLGTDTPLIIRVVGIGSENVAIDATAKCLPYLTPHALGTLREELDKLPSFSPIAKAMAWEKALIMATVSQAQFAKPRDRLTHLALGARYSAMASHWDEAAKIMALPLHEFLPAWEQFCKTVSHEELHVLFPQLVQVRRREAQIEARRALLRAAVEVTRSGPQVLQNSKDPFGNGPIACRQYQSSWVLVSALRYEDDEVSVVIERPQEENRESGMR